MAEAKQQHYVPQFYLRNFAIGAKGKALGMFNIKSDRFIPCASLRDQASKDYFYGKDGRIEQVFPKLEGLVATTISEILRTSMLPPYQSERHYELLIFTLFLHQRYKCFFFYLHDIFYCITMVGYIRLEIRSSA